MPYTSQPAPPYWLNADLSTAEHIRHFEKIPLDERGLPQSTYHLLRQSAAYSPDRIALSYFADPDQCESDTASITFRQLIRKINQTANWLHTLGITKDDVVPMLLANVPESQYALWGTQAAAIANPLNWMLEPDALAHLIRSTNARVLMAYGGDSHTDTWDKVDELLRRCPQLSYVIRLGGDKCAIHSSGVSLLDFDDEIEKYDGESLISNRTFSDMDVASIFATGGTTARPKLARHSHKNEVVSAWLSATVAGLKAGESRMSATPLFHVVGAVTGCLATLARGARLVLPTPSGWRHPRLLPNFWRVIATLEVNMTTVVPAIMNQLIHIPLEHPIDCLHTVLSGSAPVSEHVVEQFTRLTGLPIREGYGLTESTSVIAMNPKDGVIKTGTVGLLFPYHQARVLVPRADGETPHADLKPTRDRPAEGLLTLSGPCIFPGYVDAAFENDTWIDGHWLNTGDWVQMDADGYIRIVGRQKDLIVRGGHNIDPKAMEEVLYSHPDVLEAAVVGRPDAYAGEVPVAYVALKKGVQTSSEQLIRYASEHAGERAAVPKSCYLRPTLPKSSVGKILKNELRMDATIIAFEAALEHAGIGADCVVSARTSNDHSVRCHIAVHTPSAYKDAKSALLTFTQAYQIELVSDPAATVSSD